MHREEQILAAAASLVAAGTTGAAVYQHRPIDIPETVELAVDCRIGPAAVVSTSSSSIEWELDLATVLHARTAATDLVGAVLDLAEDVHAALLAGARNLGLDSVSVVRPAGHGELLTMGDDLPTAELRLDWIVTYCSSRSSVAV